VLHGYEEEEEEIGQEEINEARDGEILGENLEKIEKVNQL